MVLRNDAISLLEGKITPKVDHVEHARQCTNAQTIYIMRFLWVIDK